jgi:hypothetical protein
MSSLALSFATRPVETSGWSGERFVASFGSFRYIFTVFKKFNV